MEKHKLILASKSVARAEILKENNISFIVKPANIMEENYNFSPVSKLVTILAIEKCKFIALKYPDQIILSADSLISFNNNNIETILGKPKDSAHAKIMLKLLSGKNHFATTGVCIYNPSNKEFFCDFEVTEVVFKVISNNLLERYITSKEYQNKCGSYAIQGIAKELFIKEINGDINNVRGLPMSTVKDLLNKAGLKEFLSIN